MKKKYIAYLVALLTWHSLFAQKEIKISELYIPTSPGFVLADKSPSSIEKPTTPKAFGINLLSLREGGAIEATPYWLVNHSAYSFDDYFKKKFPIKETFSISTATFKTDTTSAVSIGFRTQLVRLYSKKSRDIINSKKKEMVELLSVEEFTPGALDSIEKARKELSDIRSKVTFNLEVAAAVIGISKNNSFENLASNKSGVWINLRFRPNKFPLDITALTRYNSWANKTNPKVGTDSAFLDYGLSVSFQKPNFDIALEYVKRHDLSIKTNSDRLAFVVNYMITENIFIVGSFGKNFDKINNLITLFGVKFGLSNEKAKLN